MLAFLLIAAAIALFFMTALAGRVFCGYMCFQTVWTDLFLYVEKLFEGDRKLRMKLDQGPWDAQKWLAKIGKHLIWMVISLLTGLVFVFYFADAPTIFKEFLDGSAPSPAWITLGFLTLSTYIMAGFAREQVCIYMCPYARFQGAMFDPDTIIVAYHPELGEPRQGNRRERLNPDNQVGHCIDCKQCVNVCPTGIDIREGQQYQCITCAACIDACDEVMAKTRSGVRLIRYTSLQEMSGGKTHYLRPRTFVYSLILLVLFSGIGVHFVLRPPVDVNVLRHRQPIYVTMSDGSVQNNYTMRVLNMSTQTQNYALRVTGLPGSTLSVAAVEDASDIAQPVLRVAPGEVMPFTIYLRQAMEHLSPGQTNFEFVLQPLDASNKTIHFASVFMRP